MESQNSCLSCPPACLHQVTTSTMSSPKLHPERCLFIGLPLATSTRPNRCCPPATVLLPHCPGLDPAAPAAPPPLLPPLGAAPHRHGRICEGEGMRNVHQEECICKFLAIF